MNKLKSTIENTCDKLITSSENGSRFWCFTAFDNNELHLLKSSSFTKYICWGIEICPSTGKKHYQGYIEFKKKLDMKNLKKINRTTHFEKRYGTQEQAINYCKGLCEKKGNEMNSEFFEYGDKDCQGKRTDLLDLKYDLDQNVSLSYIAENHFDSFLKYNRSIKNYMEIRQQERSWKTDLEIYIGPPGCGKSYFARSQNPNAYWCMRPGKDHVWWDGYIGQDVIILDDFYGWMPWDLLLRLADQYPLKLEIKGGTTNCLAKKIVITSNQTPDKWYPNIAKDIDRFRALTRRITLYKDDFEENAYIDKDKIKEIENKIFSIKNV